MPEKSYTWEFDHQINYGQDAKLDIAQKRRMLEIIQLEGYVRACDNFKHLSPRIGMEFQEAQKKLNRLTLRQKPATLWGIMVRDSQK